MNARSYGRAVSSTLLTNALKCLRQAAGQQHKLVADALSWPVSKLIRIESGSTLISTDDLESLLRHYAVDQELTDTLGAYASDAGSSGWWDSFRVLNEAFERYVAYESDASSIRMAQGLLIPGLLQTADYAIVAASLYPSAEQVDSIVELRLERQRTVFSRAPEQHHIIDEAVLRRRMGEAMPGQLRHLLELAQQPQIAIRIIPFEAGPHFGLCGPFALLSFDVPVGNVLFLEDPGRADLTVCEGLIVGGEGVPRIDDAGATIAAYEDTFEALAQIALDQAGSINLLERIVGETDYRG
jgi:hypothetical protein